MGQYKLACWVALLQFSSECVEACMHAVQQLKGGHLVTFLAVTEHLLWVTTCHVRSPSRCTAGTCWYWCHWNQQLGPVLPGYYT
jgi:hypothetical protein